MAWMRSVFVVACAACAVAIPYPVGGDVELVDGRVVVQDDLVVLGNAKRYEPSASEQSIPVPLNLPSAESIASPSPIVPEFTIAETPIAEPVITAVPALATGVGNGQRPAAPAQAENPLPVEEVPGEVLTESPYPNLTPYPEPTPDTPAPSPEAIPAGLPLPASAPLVDTPPSGPAPIAPVSIPAPSPKGKDGGPYSAEQEHPTKQAPPTPQGPVIPGDGYVPKSYNGARPPPSQGQHPAMPGMSMPKPAPKGALPAPPGCKKLPTDSDWPRKEVWDKELKGWELIMPSGRNRHPQVMYEVKTVQSVQRAVKFAAKHDLRLSIVNSGHDFLGRNDAPSGILLDVSGLKGARVLESFTPSPRGVPLVNSKTETNVITYRPGAAVTFGGGMSTSELNNELAKSSMWTVGAAHGEVTVAGGWSQAGGHGTLTHQYGLGADNALEFKLVDANGDLRVANAAVNKDLFWAIRGGGGSTFGVVVEATFKAYAMPTVYSYQFFINTTDYNDKRSIFAPAAYLASQMPRILDQGGMAGYIYLHPNAIRAQLYAPNEYANRTNMKAVLEPILDHMATMPGMTPDLLLKYPPWQGMQFADMISSQGLPPIPGVMATNLGYPLGKVPREPWMPGIPAVAAGLGNLIGSLAGSSAPSSFDTAFQSTREVIKRHEPGEGMRVPRGIQNMDSRMMGREELSSPYLAEALRRTMPFEAADGQIRFHLVSGPKVWSQGQDSAVNPAWRKTYAHLLASGGGKPNAQALRDISPGMGAYVNEASIHNPNWKKDFWGSNYARLSQIKSRWDRNMVFYVTPGINADHMIVKGDRLCRLQGPSQEFVGSSPPIGDNQNIAPHVKDYVSFPRLFGVAPASPVAPGAGLGSFFGNFFGGKGPVVPQQAPVPARPTGAQLPPYSVPRPQATSVPRPSSIPRPAPQYTVPRPQASSIPRPAPRPLPTPGAAPIVAPVPAPVADPATEPVPEVATEPIPDVAPISDQLPNLPPDVPPVPAANSQQPTPELPGGWAGLLGQNIPGPPSPPDEDQPAVGSIAAGNLNNFLGSLFGRPRPAAPVAPAVEADEEAEETIPAAPSVEVGTGGVQVGTSTVTEA